MPTKKQQSEAASPKKEKASKALKPNEKLTRKGNIITTS